jgi:hypothetical protein
VGCHELIGKVYNLKEKLAEAITRNNVEKIGVLEVKIHEAEAEISLIAARKFLSNHASYRHSSQ